MNIKNEMVRYARLMYEKGYSVAQEGNISFRTGIDRIVITPSNRIKKFLEKKDLVEIDMKGEKIRGDLRPSSERFTHLELYRKDPETRAVVHAHPFYTLLLTAMGEDPFRKKFLAESAMFLKDAVMTPFAKPSTRDGAEAVRNIPAERSGAKVVVMDRHGSFTCGKDIPSAFSLLEVLEKHCKMVYLAGLSGKELRCFTDEEIKSMENIEYGDASSI